MRRVIPALLLIGLLAIVPRAMGARVHTALQSSNPAAGDTLGVVPEQLELRFTGPIEQSGSEVVLVDGLGERTVLLPAGDGDSRSIVRGLPPLTAGGYRVEWRALAADGHPVEGSFVFYVAGAQTGEAAGGATLQELRAPPPGELAGEPIPIAAALLRAGGIGALATLAGLLLLAGWFASTQAGRTWTLILVFAWVAPVLLAGHALAWVAYAFGADAGPDPIRQLLSNVPGRVEVARFGLAALTLWAVALARRPRLGALFAVAAVLVSGLAGHSLSFVPEVLVPARAIHVAGLTLWAGGLLLLLATRGRGEEFQQLVGTVSSLSLAAIGLLAVTGVAHILLYPMGLVVLATSTYGALLIAKIVGFVTLVGFGARARFRLVPRLPDDAAGHALRRNVAWEVGIMTVIFVLTGFLAYTPVPDPVVEPDEFVLVPE